MTQKEKQLLLKDICARLPYGVYVLVHDTFKYSTVPYKNVYLKSSDIASLIDLISLNKIYNSRDKIFNKIIKEQKDYLEFKPYLRPMSSMTEEELKEFRACHCVYDLHPDFQPMMCNIANEQNMFDWLNKNHFDYRGLIGKGLALEATEGMYNIESQDNE